MSTTTPFIQPIQAVRSRSITWRAWRRRDGGTSRSAPSTSGWGRTAM